MIDAQDGSSVHGSDAYDVEGMLQPHEEVGKNGGSWKEACVALGHAEQRFRPICVNHDCAEAREGLVVRKVHAMGRPWPGDTTVG